MTWCQAAGLVLPPGAALSHRSAAFLFGVDLLPRGAARVEATVPSPARFRRTERLDARRAVLPPDDVERRSGLPVTNRWRTAFDLGRHENPVAAVLALDALLYRRVISVAALRDIAAARTGWPGVVRFREAVQRARLDVESPMESRLRLLLVLAGLPEPTVQHRVFDANGQFVARLDLAYEELRIGLEFDGDHHRDRATFRRDAVRINRLRLCDWTVLRFTADDVMRHPDRVVAQVMQALKIATNGTPRMS